MDSLLREAMTAPPPGLSSNFDRQLAKRLRPQNLSLTARLVLAVYALIALLVSVWALRPLPIHWTFVWTFVIGTLAPVSLGLYWIRRRLSS
jgi:antibiotic biosynthesis monooxygenase (ABM) superfamily enzyme